MDIIVNEKEMSLNWEAIMKKQPDTELLTQFLSGECTPEERQIIETWINSSPDNKRIIENLEKIWNSPRVQKNKWDIDRVWGNIVRETGISNKQQDETRVVPLQRKSKFNSVWIRVAAAIAVILIPAVYILIMGIPGQGGIEKEWKEIIVDNGTRTSFALDDGTEITLDAGSILRYPTEFGDASRDIYFQGEGYFIVAPDNEKPFKVYAENALVTVLGTKFNLRAWRENERVELVVTEGKVSFRAGDSEEHEILTENEMSVLTTAGIPSRPVKVESADYLGWMNNNLKMDNVNLSEIIGQLERWYDLVIDIDDSALSHKINIHLQKEPVDNLLDLVGAIINQRYERNGKIVRFFKEQ